MARDEIAEMTGLRLAIHAWIREDAPLAAKMNLMPCHVDALTDRIAAELASLRSQDREDGARWMREKAAEAARSAQRMPFDRERYALNDAARVIRALPLRPAQEAGNA